MIFCLKALRGNLHTILPLPKGHSSRPAVPVPPPRQKGEPQEDKTHGFPAAHPGILPCPTPPQTTRQSLHPALLLILHVLFRIIKFQPMIQMEYTQRPFVSGGLRHPLKFSLRSSSFSRLSLILFQNIFSHRKIKKQSRIRNCSTTF